MPDELDLIRHKLLELMAKPSFMPMRKRALAKRLGIHMDDYSDFRRFVEDLADEGVIAELKRGKYGLPPGGARPAATADGATSQTGQGVSLKGLPRHAIVGRVEVKRGGFGFVVTDSPGQDLYIAEEDMGGALHGDKVAVVRKRRPVARRGRRQQGHENSKARVVRILERARSVIVGTYYAKRSGRDREAWYDAPAGSSGYVVPDTRGMFGELEVLRADSAGAKSGDKVAVELVEPAERHRSGRKPTARVTRIFGKAGAVQAEYESIIENFELRTEFPQEALWQADLVEEGIPDEELDQRIDYTSPLTFAIDPPEAKDHDDAVAIRELEDGRTELLVHIADVSHYVTEGSPIDLEARERATSVYLPGHHIPMIPEQLSAGSCSLKEGRLRLTKTVRIAFSKQMRRETVHIERSYIRSAAFLNYDQVYDAIEKNKPKLLPSKEIFDTLKRMKVLAGKLRKRRTDKGSLELDLPEVVVNLDEDKRLLGCVREESHWAHNLIEEFMLAANRVVAEYLVDQEVPGLFRVHEEPEPTALEKLAEFLGELGVKMKKPYNRTALADVLERVKGKPYQHAVHMALLTSLKQALYMAECRPHFALNWNRYLHFTSPIRRYPDLIVHRALDQRFPPGEAGLPMKGKRRKGGEQAPEHFKQVAFLRGVAQHCSYQERNAESAEREVTRFYLIQHLKENKRASHPGLITGVRSFGLFVELQDCFVEGQVRIQDLADDYYDYYPESHLLQGRRNRRSFRLGDKVTVRVVHIDPGQKRVGLVLV